LAIARRAGGCMFEGVVEILEQGAISFLAVPRADAAAPAGPADLRSFFVVLAPAEGPLRRLSVRRRMLPDPRRRQRFYAHVDRLAAAPARLTADVRAGGARRGLRGAGVLAVGRYALARHGDHVHLAYALVRACGRGRLAVALGVAPGASFLLGVSRRSHRTRRPAPEAPLAPATPDRLDVVGAEVALVAVGRAPEARVGLEGGDRVGEALVGALLRRGPRPRQVARRAATSRA
jgi:hypothetical protein